MDSSNRAIIYIICVFRDIYSEVSLLNCVLKGGSCPEEAVVSCRNDFVTKSRFWVCKPDFRLNFMTAHRH